MEETVLFFDVSATAAIDSIARFVVERGFVISHQSPYSVSFGGAGAIAGAGTQKVTVAAASARAAKSGSLRVGAGSLGEGLLPAGTGQAAAVPVQLKPEWCRVWLVVNGGAAVECAEALIERDRERSGQVEAEVKRLEAAIYDDSQWASYEARLRAGMTLKGMAEAEVEAKLAGFKKVWQGLGRKAAASPPDSPTASPPK